MNRAAIAALWIGSLVITWRLVRSDEPTREAATPAAPTVANAPTFSGVRVHHIATPPPALDDRAFRAAEAQLEKDIADGRWSVADRDRLNIALAQVTGKQADHLIMMLFPKINDGTVKNEVDGPPI